MASTSQENVPRFSEWYQFYAGYLVLVNCDSTRKGFKE